MTFKFGQTKTQVASPDTTPNHLEVTQRSPQFIKDCCRDIQSQLGEIQTLVANGAITQGLLNERTKSILERIPDLKGQGLEALSPALDKLIGSAPTSIASGLDLNGLKYLSKYVEVQVITKNIESLAPDQKPAALQLLTQHTSEMSSFGKSISDTKLVEGISVVEKHFQAMQRSHPPTSLEGQNITPETQKTAFGFGKKNLTVVESETPAAPRLVQRDCCDPKVIAANLKQDLKVIEAGNATPEFKEKAFEKAFKALKEMSPTDPARQELATFVAKSSEVAHTNGHIARESAVRYKADTEKVIRESVHSSDPRNLTPPAAVNPRAKATTVNSEAPQPKLESKFENKEVKVTRQSESKLPETPKAEKGISEPQRVHENETPRLQENRSPQQSKQTSEYSRESNSAFKESPAARNPSEQISSRSERPAYTSNVLAEKTSYKDQQINNRLVEQGRIEIPRINRDIFIRQVPEVSRQADRSNTVLESSQRVSSFEKLPASRQESLSNIRDLVREMNRLPASSNRVALENLRVALNRAGQDPILRQQAHFIRLNRQVNNQLLVREVDRLSRHLERGSKELSSKQASELLRRLSKMDGKSLSSESAEQLRKLLRRLDPNSKKSLSDKIDPKLVQMLARQIQQILQQRLQSQPDNRLAIQRILESNKLASLSLREKSLVDRIGQLKEALRLQQLYAKQLGDKLSPGDRAQLKKQEKIFNRRIDKLEAALSRNRSIQERIINRLIAQIKVGQIPQKLSVADRQALINAIDSRVSLLTERITNLQKQLETIRQLRARLLDPVLLKNLLKQERGLERRITLLEKEIDKLRGKKALLNSKEENLKRIPGERQLRISRMQDAMLRRRLATSSDPQLRAMTHTHRLLIVVKSELRDILRDFAKSGRFDFSQVQRDLLTQRMDKLIRLLSARETTTPSDLVRLKRLSEIQLMLREGQELSARLLEELLELVGEELEEVNGSLSARKSRRRTKSLQNFKQLQQQGPGPEIEQVLSNNRKSNAKVIKQVSSIKARQVFNSKTGNKIGVSASLPTRSLDIVQSKEDDDEKNEYWKELNSIS